MTGASENLQNYLHNVNSHKNKDKNISKMFIPRSENNQSVFPCVILLGKVKFGPILRLNKRI